MPIPAIDCIKNRRGYPRTKLPDVKWDVIGSGTTAVGNEYQLEIDGSLVSGTVDWDKSRHLEDEFYCWVVDMYYVLDSDMWVRKPVEPEMKWGPGSYVFDDENM
jgi:hypothetical protein